MRPSSTAISPSRTVPMSITSSPLFIISSLNRFGGMREFWQTKPVIRSCILSK